MVSSARPSDSALVAEARNLIGRAYAPYSNFDTGAVVAAESGEIVGGTIVENVSLGLAMCAERVAMFSAVAAGLRPVALALAAPSTRGAMTWPCGACLQVALELGGPGLVVVVGDHQSGPTQRAVLADLLPRGPHVAR